MKDRRVVKCAYSQASCRKCPVKVRRQCTIRNGYETLKERLDRFIESSKIAKQKKEVSNK